MRVWIGIGVGLAMLAAQSAAACPAENPQNRERVDLQTVLGDVCIEMLDGPDEAKGTENNFLAYVARGDYDGTFIHRSVPGFVLQGGGYSWTEEDGYVEVPSDPPIENEPAASNLRGTVAMAKQSGNPDSASNEWFINLADNVELDVSNGGFTVFARVLDEDMDVVDAIEALHTESGQLAILDPLRSRFTHLPVLELLERDPDGYGCLIVFPDPEPIFVAPFGAQADTTACATQEELNDAVALTREAMDPQVPERLVVIEQAVPEPGAWLQLVAGAAALLAGRRRAR